MPEKTPIRPTDDEARALAWSLIEGARFAALAVTLPSNGQPMVTRIALTTASDGVPLSLISDLSQHTGALRANPDCSLLIGEPGARGDPLTHPRLTLQARAEFVRRDSDTLQELRARYLERLPKAGLYIDFADFNLVRLPPREAFLNGGFGRAYHLAPEDLAPPPAI